jgi:membrane protein implicated in regulation of membrane protease activity
MNIKNKNAFIVGMIPAILEGLLIHFADPTASNWILIQSILFWFSCGFVVYLIDFGINKIISCILLTVLLNLPWYISLSIGSGKIEHLVPLIVSSIVMGLIIGLVSKRLNKSDDKTTNR